MQLYGGPPVYICYANYADAQKCIEAVVGMETWLRDQGDWGQRMLVYVKILEKHVLEYHDDIKQSVTKITEATMAVYLTIKEKLPRTPVKFHYIFNLRDLSRVYEGLLNTTPDKIADKAVFVRLWRNECQRVFCDRLINSDDQGANPRLKSTS